ncbi:MAG: GDSL family lipase [Lachnospiraceae bacterium]|nr:GDSL family lipase [Lachnospiraceae bacterium]
MRVKICGRHVEKDGILYLCFSGAYVEFEFTGKKASAVIKTDKADDPGLIGFVGVFVNGEYKDKLKLDKAEGVYSLFEAKEAQKVVIRLMRFSENNFGKVGIKEITADGEICPTSDKNFKMEFIGDSITCGYGVEAADENETFRTETENPAKAYAVLAAEELNADFQLVSWSGNGLLTQWIPPEADEPDVTVPLMPVIYKWQDFGGYEFEGYSEPQPHDFTSFVPDIVVVNLGTNDASYTRNKEKRVEAFGQAYAWFLRFIRSKRQKAKIVCCLGVMNTDLCDEVKRQVEIMNETDKDVFFIRQELIGNGEAYGADWHPGEKAQKRIAKQLVEFVRGIV